MAHILKTRVAESSTSISTGDMTLAGALTGHVTYSSVCSIGDTTEYVIYGADAYGFPTGEWEEGIGTYSALNTLTRTTPKNGSAATPVDFSAGTKIVIMTPLGSRVGAIPRGGSINQVLSKASGNDHDLAWVDVAASGTIDATPTDGSSNAVSSNGVFDALAGKSDTGHNHSGTYDPAGTASAALSAHTGAADPHPGYALESTIGAAGGIAPLDGTGKVAAAYLPSYVDDVIEAANFAALPGTGETGKIYVTLDDGKAWRWGGSAYAEISASPGSTDAVTEGSTNLYHTAARVRATVLTGLSTALGTVVTAAHTVLEAIGFLQKQISDAVSSIAGKQDTLVSGTNIKTINSTSLLGSGDLTVSASPGGSTTQVQFNDSGAFGGDAGLTYDKTTDTLYVPRISAAGSIHGIQISAGGVALGQFAAGNPVYVKAYEWLGLGRLVGLRWAGSGSWDGSATPDVGMDRNAAGVVEINNGTAGTYRDLKLRNLIGTGNLATGAVAKSADYTATTSDGTIEVDASGAARTITLFAASGNAGKIIVVKKIDSSANAVTVDGNASETIDGATTISLASQYSTAILQVNAAGTGWNKLAGV